MIVYTYFLFVFFFCYIRLRKVPRLHKQQSNNRINNVNKAKDSYSPLRFSIFIPSSYYLWYIYVYFKGHVVPFKLLSHEVKRLSLSSSLTYAVFRL